MATLKKEDVLREKNTSDPNSITSLTLTHKALSNVSCLSEFNNLQRLDLKFNNLTSLQGLEKCVNLKWLSVQQNKLSSLKGVETLTNLTVFNAGKNKLRSMDEVKNLVRLRALILNDNEIATISGLEKMPELNTLVLSRNPIQKMGDSLAKLKSIVKVSLSNCQLDAIDSSIKGCPALEQLRLAHNDIKALPAELAYNKKLHILDVGNNMISRWSDIEELASLRNLKNLNLLGNPIAEKAKLLKKVKKLVPNLQIFNAKRMDKLNQVEKNEKAEHVAASVVDDVEPLKRKKKDLIEKHVLEDANTVSTTDVDSDKHVNQKEYQQEGKRDYMEENNSTKTILSPEAERSLDEEIEMTKSKKKKKKLLEKDLPLQEADKTKTHKSSKRKAEKAGIDAIDDKETSFAEFLAYDASENTRSNDGEQRDRRASNIDLVSPLVTYPTKKKKCKNQGAGASVFEFVDPAPEVGLGGPSAWDMND